jgi:hypothetical protein
VDRLGHEVGVLAQRIAGALDLDDDGVVKQSVERAMATTRALVMVITGMAIPRL